MIVLKVTRWAVNVENLVFTDATRVAVAAYRRRLGCQDELIESLWDVPTAARIELGLPNFGEGRLGQFRSGDWFLGSTEDRRGLIAHHPGTGRTVLEPVPGVIGGLALTPDGKTVLFSWYDGSDIPKGYGGRTWADAGAFGPGFRVPFDQQGDGHWLYPLADGGRFVTRGMYVVNPHLRTRSVATGEILSSGGLAVFEQVELAVAPDGRNAVAAVQKSLYLFSTDNLRNEQRVVYKDGSKHFTDVAYHPSGNYLAATSNDETVLIYDTTSWKLARTFTWDIGRMRSVAFSADGMLAAAGGDKGKVVVWDVDF